MMWEDRLMSFGVPQCLATRMSYDLEASGLDPYSYTNINQLYSDLQGMGFQTYGWWEDLLKFFQDLMTKLTQVLPGILITALGIGVAYGLRNIKVKDTSLGLVGLIPIGVGMWMVVQPFLPKPEGTA